MFCSIAPTHGERLFVLDSLGAPQNICCLLSNKYANETF